ncbi:hypothetical protein CDAR_107751 [Caerostris darwini]|uniref:Uncharacterized protein n=1 Tax=Caerostris darwini TaxID=1538125 RepID=A0AAV4T304_9ARAC|nr:hypothetical protein CDAR_107751 [Caerostris darwini]
MQLCFIYALDNNHLIKSAHMDNKPSIYPTWEKNQNRMELFSTRRIPYLHRWIKKNLTGCAIAVYKDDKEICHFTSRLNNEATVDLTELKVIEMAVNYTSNHLE